MSDPVDLQAQRTAREAEGYYELGIFDEALCRADSLLAEGKLEDFALPMRAECLRSLEHWQEGTSAFEEILRRTPDDVSAHVGLGWCWKRAGRLDLAKEAMERLLLRRPAEPIGLYNLACYCALAGERERSLALLARSIEKDESFRALAGKEKDFASVRDEPEFQRILG
jgi:Flp pilus assembly protein TadD